MGIKEIGKLLKKIADFLGVPRKPLTDPLPEANDLGYHTYQVVDRGLTHADEQLEKLNAFVDASIAEHGGFKQDYAYLYRAHYRFVDSLYGLKESHSIGAMQQKKFGVRGWIPEDWPGFGGGR